MALQLFASNSLTELAKKLSADMQLEEVSVFQPYYIVTQTEGMNNWLKLQIARYNSIAANCIFVKPSEMIQQVYTTLGGRHPHMLSSSNLTWLIYTILGDKEFNDRYRHIANYYAAALYDKDVKRIALAEKVTDLFDQYQVYRPEMIAAWNSVNEDAAMDWQQFLWKKAKLLSGNMLPDKTMLREHIIATLKDAGKASQLHRKIPSIHLFGLSVTTVYHLNIFNILSANTDIKYYLQNPSPDFYWFEDRSEKEVALLQRKGWKDKEISSNGNALLTNWGRIISNTFTLLFQNEAALNAYQETNTTEPLKDTLLHKIQHDIYYNADKEERNAITAKDLEDGSVTINACYTIAREVEIFYNYLVYLADQKKEMLSSRDMVVMVTDIDAYAPYIKAVFNHAPYQFKYTIADESMSVGDGMITALKGVMAMNRQNFKAEEVLQLLDSAFIRKRFGINNLPLIRKAVDKANIRFGIDGRVEDETLFVSWPYGINRIMYGLCMSGEEEYHLGNETLYPLDIAEGNDAFELIRFTHFVQVLTDSINERKYERSIAEWVEYTERVVQNLICETDEETIDAYNIILSELEKLNVVTSFVTENISFEIFSHSFLQSISSSVRTGSFAGGGITFCSLIPMRSIPFKVVALMGLNFDKFPRKEHSTGFNLMEVTRMKGDRNVKDNDKHLFLETILSAQQYLYISYIGQSTKDNTILPPSALVDELTDYIETASTEPHKAKSLLIKRHPLHSFSKKYNNGNSGFYNYLNDNQTADALIKNEAKTAKLFSFENVKMHDFTSFFKHPFKAYYNKVLSIYYEEESVLLSGTELFQLDSLQKWNLKNELLHLESDEMVSIKNKLVKTGRLPLKNMADISIEALKKDLDKVKKLWNDCVEDKPPRTISIELDIDDTKLNGIIENVYGHKLVYISYAKHELKYMLEAYIIYLAAKVQDNAISLHFVSAERQQVFDAVEIPQAEAVARLIALMQLYKQGHKSILLFHPVFRIEPHKVATLETEGFAKLIKEVFNNFMVPCEDQYLLHEYASDFFDGEDAAKTFKENCAKLIAPLEELFPDYFN